MSFNEFDIIDRYFSHLWDGDADDIVMGSGDDCAVLRVPEGRELCWSTDTLVADVHFPAWAPPAAVAHRGLAANVSDLAAMGASPRGCLLALTLTEPDDAWLAPFSQALGRCSRKWDIPVIGGNIARGRELSLTFSVIGAVEAGQALTRSGAGDGDDVYVTGSPGDAGAGLAMVLEDREATGTLVDRYFYPEPRLAVGRGLIGLASAAIDVSDGLAADLGHVARASGLDLKVDVTELSLSAALVEYGGTDGARRLALSAGDDYELCFTAPAAFRDRIAALATQTDVSMTRIGVASNGQGRVLLVDDRGEPVVLAETGYRHF